MNPAAAKFRPEADAEERRCHVLQSPAPRLISASAGRTQSGGVSDGLRSLVTGRGDKTGLSCHPMLRENRGFSKAFQPDSLLDLTGSRTEKNREALRPWIGSVRRSARETHCGARSDRPSDRRSPPCNNRLRVFRSRSSREARRLGGHSPLTSIFLTSFWASAVFGKVTVRTPFLKVAAILSVSTASGTLRARS